MDDPKRIMLKPGKEQSIRRFHPWIFSGAIKSKEENINEGDPVEILSAGGEYLATGQYQSGSIAVRLFSFDSKRLNGEFWDEKIRAALKLRDRVGLSGSPDTSVFRLVNAEGDGLPGLVIDLYNGVAVLQAHTAGIHRVRKDISGSLRRVLGEKLNSVYYRGMQKVIPDPGIEPGIMESRAGGRSTGTGYLYGSGADPVVAEYGNRFRVDWVGGQKTGFFIDQRENRNLLSYYSSGKKVLNMFGYTGGFSVYALRGGAAMVHTVDVSPSAIETANENVGLNFPSGCPHKAYSTDVFDYFRNSNEKYDIIVLDPPAFAKGNRARNNALQAYQRLNARGIAAAEKGGFIFTFSCSQVVSREQFRQAVYSAAIRSGREIRILHHLSQPADHPVNIYHPEGEYLKGLVLQVL